MGWFFNEDFQNPLAREYGFALRDDNLRFQEVEMALKRLTGYAIVCFVFLGLSAWAQEPSQDGVLLLEGYGPVYGLGESGSAANNFPGLSFDFGLNIARDMELVSDVNGTVVGGYALDVLGGQTTFGSAKSIADLAAEGNAPPFFGWDIARDLEIAPNWREATNNYDGYIVMDGLGGIHPVGKLNLPQYPFGPEGQMIDSPFPEYLITKGVQGEATSVSALNALKAGTVANFSSVRPVFTYFGWDIARDLEVTAQFVTVTSELIVERMPGGDPILPSFATVSAASKGRKVGVLNGYYILDGLGAVHSCRLPLQFDVNDDGKVDDIDLESEDFGKPANYLPLALPWFGSQNMPWFGWDIARDMELTPSGRGCYLLNGYGSVYLLGDARGKFPNASTPYFGFDIARALALVPTKQGDLAAGYLVVDAFGQVYEAGYAKSYDITEVGANGESVFSIEDSFADIEITPAFTSTRMTFINPRYAVTVAPPSADISSPGVTWRTDLVSEIVPSFKVSTAPYPFFDYVISGP
ncbi:MAG: hypothetical protein ABIH23_06695 [bacterium]